MSSFPIATTSRIIDSREERRLSLPACAAILSLIAAVVHAWVVRSHVSHWWAYGAFFAGLAVVQAAYAVIVTRRPSRRVAAVGVAGNALVLALYVWSRTVGAPTGPHSGKAESIGVPDLVAAAAEVALIVALVLIFRDGGGDRSRRVGRASIAAILVALAAAGAVGPAGAGHPRTPASITLADGSQLSTAPPPLTTQPPLPTADESVSSDPTPAQEWEPSKCVVNIASGVTALEAAAPGHARAVAYSSGQDVWIYDPATNKANRVTEHQDYCWSSHPSFRSPNYLSFTGSQAVYGFDIASGGLEELFEIDHGLMTMTWSPDGKTLAYLTSWSGTRGGPQLITYRPADGTKKVLRTFPLVVGGCGGGGGEISLSWAPDGHGLIVVTTHLEGGETMFVLDPSGKDLVPPRSGTSGRWAPDSRRIYYRDFEDDRKWHTLNSETGDTGTLGAMKPATSELAVSPDGSMLAYSEGGEDPATYVYEVATKTQRKIADDAVMPVWLDLRTILVTATKSCGDECTMSPWTPDETTSIVDVFTEERTDATAGPTWFADAWIEPLPDAEPSPVAPAPSPSETATPAPAPSDDPIPEPSPTSSTSPSPEPSPTPTG